MHRFLALGREGALPQHCHGNRERNNCNYPRHVQQVTHKVTQKQSHHNYGGFKRRRRVVEFINYFQKRHLQTCKHYSNQTAAPGAAHEQVQNRKKRKMTRFNHVLEYQNAHNS